MRRPARRTTSARARRAGIRGHAARHVGRRWIVPGAARARHRRPRHRRGDRDLRRRRGAERCLDRHRRQPHRHRRRLDADRSRADGDAPRRRTTAPPHDHRRQPPANPAAVTWPAAGAAGRSCSSRCRRRTAVAAAAAKAAEARSGGLRRVGVLDSSRYASLHPGYYVVFTGVFDTEAEAASALQRARAVFPAAYQREIVP